MRLRKRNIRTQFQQACTEFSRFKLLKRQRTELLGKHNISQDFVGQMQKHGHHTKSSCNLNYNPATPKFFKGRTNKKTKISWINLQTSRYLGSDNHRNQKSEIAVSQMNILNKHLLNVTRNSFRAHKRTVTEPIVSLVSSRKKRQNFQRQPMDSKLYEKCCGIVDGIYNKVKLLRELGYAQFKINEWVLNFCESRRPYMKDIFMKNVSKSVYTLKEEFELERNVKIVKQKIKYKIQKGKEIMFFVQEEELAEFCKYLQEILIQKNSQKAKQVQSSIIQKLSTELVPRLKNKFFVFTKKEPIQVQNFVVDLAQFQHKYGDFISLSKVNKLKFLQLNRVQHNLKNTYQQMLQSQIKKIVKQSHDEVQTPLSQNQPGHCIKQ